MKCFIGHNNVEGFFFLCVVSLCVKLAKLLKYVSIAFSSGLWSRHEMGLG